MPNPKANNGCPDLGQYQRLLSAQLPEGDKESVLRHLEGCDSCAHKLNSLPEENTLVGLLRQANTLGDEASGKSIARLVERLSKLRPSKPLAAPEAAAMLSFACPACGKNLKVAAEFAGKKGRCTRCKGALRIPFASGAVQGRAHSSEHSLAEQSLSISPQSHATIPPSLAGKSASGANPPGKDKEPTYDFLAPPQALDEMGRLGSYRVLQVLGAGGMGVVFRAEDPQLARFVALKAMLPGLASSDSARQRFLREARAAAAITHDHIIAVYQVGEDRGVPFLAMPFLEGEPLDQRLQRQGTLSVAEVMRIGREIALGLAAAHRCGLIHRDIKPANIWLEGEPGGSATGGRVKILDFGLARPISEEGHLTQLGTVVGTPAYMAPEQGLGKHVDARCDLFSLGCVLYRMATGKNAFTGSDTISTLMAVAMHHPPAPDQLNRATPRGLSKLIMDLLAKEPDDRPVSAQAVAETLERLPREQAAPPVAVEGKPGPPPIPPIPSPVLDPSPFHERMDPSSPPVALNKAKKGRTAVLALTLAVMLGLGGWFLAALVFRIKVKAVEGEACVVLEIEQPNPEVFIDGKKIRVTVPGDNKPVQIQVEPGQHMLRISKDGFVAVTRDVELTVGKFERMRVRLEPVTKAVQNVPARRLADALRRADIPAAVFASPGGGDPKQTPAELVAVLGDPGWIQRVVDRLRIHRAMVGFLTFSADGRWLASVSNDRTIVLWETATRRIRRVLPTDASAVLIGSPTQAVAFSKDGRTLVSANRDGALQFWPTETDAEAKTAATDLGAIGTIAASPDGRFLAARSRNGATKLWRWGEWTRPITLAAVPGNATTLAFGLDGEVLATGGWEPGPNGTAIRLYRSTDGKPTDTLPGHRDTVRTLAVSRDGKFLASAGTDNKARVWDLASGKSIAEFTLSFVHGAAVAFSPDGKMLAASQRERVEIFDLAAPARNGPLYTVSGSGQICGLSFSPDGKFLVVGDETGAVILYDATGWNQKNPSPVPGHRKEVEAVAFSPDGRWLASGSADQTVRVWDLATGKQRHKLKGHTATVGSVAFSPDGNVLASSSFDGSIVFWDSLTGARLRTATGSFVRFSPDGKSVAVGAGDGVRMWDTRNGEGARRLGGLHEKFVRCLAFSPDGRRLATGGDDGKLVITDLAAGKVLHSFKRNTGVVAVEFAADGNTVAAGYQNPEPVVRLWNLKDNDFVVLKGHTDTVSSVSLRSDGRLAVTTSNDGSVRLWEIGGNQPRKMVLGMGSVGEKLWRGALSPDGRYVATGNSNGTINLYRLPGPAENVGAWLAVRGSVLRGLSEEAWLQRVKGLSIGNVIAAVSDRLRDLNPGFDRQLSPTMEDGVVTELIIERANVKDVSPVRAFSGLRTLECQCGPLADLSPLKDLKLTRLNCAFTPVSDLTPLKDMRLTDLSCDGTKVSDLTPLKDMRLTELNCSETSVSDLTPLKDMKLKILKCHHLPVSDLTPLKDMKLTYLNCSSTQVSDLTPLKDMKLTDLWCHDSLVSGAALAPLQEMFSLRWLEIGGPNMTDDGLKHLNKLPALEILKSYDSKKVTGAGLVHLEGMRKLQHLALWNTGVTDANLIHLKGLFGLRMLELQQTKVTDAGLEHLTGLKNLVELRLHGTQVTAAGVAKLKAALPRCNITR